MKLSYLLLAFTILSIVTGALTHRQRPRLAPYSMNLNE